MTYRFDFDPPMFSDESGGAKLMEFNPHHGADGRFASGVGFAATNETLIPSLAADALAKGEQPTVLPEDVGETMSLLAHRTDDPDLTELKVEGTLKFGGDGLGIARKDMPQLPEGAQREAYFADLHRRGIRVTTQDIDPQALHPTQKEISARVSGQLYEAIKSGHYHADNHLTVSKDNYVADGHHRWGAVTAYSFEKPGYTVTIDKVDMPIDRLLKDAEKFDSKAGIAHKAMGQEHVIEAAPKGRDVRVIRLEP